MQFARMPQELIHDIAAVRRIIRQLRPEIDTIHPHPSDIGFFCVIFIGMHI